MVNKNYPATSLFFMILINKFANTDVIGQISEGNYETWGFPDTPFFNRMFVYYDAETINIIKNSGSFLFYNILIPYIALQSGFINFLAVKLHRYPFMSRIGSKF